MGKDYEMLLSFQVIDENELLNHIRVLIKTDKNEYNDIWSYKISKYDRYGEVIEGKLFETNIAKWCRDRHINMDYYVNYPTKYVVE